MDALQVTQEGLQKVLMFQQAKQREVNSIRSKEYTTKGRFQFAIADSDKRTMIAAVERKCNKHCSDIYDEINQARKQEGLSELTNQYKERK